MEILEVRRRSKKSEAGKKGGAATLKRRGPDHYAQISKQRKNFAGGRPRKQQAAFDPLADL